MKLVNEIIKKKQTPKYRREKKKLVATSAERETGWEERQDRGVAVQSLSCIRLFVTPWTAACQASLSITNSQSLLKFRSIQSVMPSYHLVLWSLLPSIFKGLKKLHGLCYTYTEE